MEQDCFTWRLGGWISETAAAWPDEAIDAARDALIDVTACIVAGSANASTSAVRSACARLGDGRSGVTGLATTLTAPWAAMVNGTAAHALDFDDNHDPSKTHASAVLYPAILALADEIDASSDRILDAFIAGIEVLTRIGQGLNPYHRSRGWHATATIGAIGAAGACARLLRLDSRAAADAISLSTGFAGGSIAQFGTLAKPFHAGKAAQGGVLAASLAQSGLKAAEEAFEGPYGLQRLMVGPDVDALRETVRSGAEHGQDMMFDLDGIERPALLRYGLKVKRFPCCGSTHRALDGLIELREQYHLTPGDIASIEVHAPAAHFANLPFTRPEDPQQARFSLEYCLAVATLNGNVTLADFTPEAVGRPEIDERLSLIRRVPVDKLESEFPTLVRIILRSGKTLETSIAMPAGSIGRPLAGGALMAKLTACCENALSASKRAALVDILTRFGDPAIKSSDLTMIVAAAAAEE